MNGARKGQWPAVSENREGDGVPAGEAYEPAGEVYEPAGEVYEPAGEVYEPAGEVYDWFVRAMRLLDGGNPEAAAELLAHAHSHEPESASVLEALARALFDARRYDEAAARFTELVELSPDDDYARFGLGLSRMRLGDLGGAIEQLALATAMRPGRPDYQRALREVRATVRARKEAGPDGGSARPWLPPAEGSGR